MGIETKIALVWIGSGILGATINIIKNVDEMKKMEPFILFIGIIFSMGAGPLALIAAFKPDVFD